MKFLCRIMDKIVDMTERYGRYKTAALLSSSAKSREEIDQILNELYGPKK